MVFCPYVVLLPHITREHILAKVRQSGHPNLASVAGVVLETTGNAALIGSSGSSRPAEPDESIIRPVARHREG